MAIGDAYVTAGELRDYARIGDSDDDLLVVQSASSASRAVEAFTRRQFNKTTTPTARRFRPADWRRLPVDDFHTITGLIVDVDGTVLDVADTRTVPVERDGGRAAGLAVLRTALPGPFLVDTDHDHHHRAVGLDGGARRCETGNVDRRCPSVGPAELAAGCSRSVPASSCSGCQRSPTPTSNNCSSGTGVAVGGSPRWQPSANVMTPSKPA